MTGSTHRTARQGGATGGPRSVAAARNLALVAAVALAFGAWAVTWTDPDTGYTWTYLINSDTAEIMV